MMSYINEADNTVNFKVAYAGPTQSGKTTNLRAVCRRVASASYATALARPAQAELGDLSRPTLYDGAPFEYLR